MEDTNTFGYLSLPLTDVGENETIGKIEISSSSSSTRSSFKMETEKPPLRAANNFLRSRKKL